MFRIIIFSVCVWAYFTHLVGTDYTFTLWGLTFLGGGHKHVPIEVNITFLDEGLVSGLGKVRFKG